MIVRFTYETKRAIIVLSLLVYFVIGITAKLSSTESLREPYPVFSWYLFADVPNTADRFTIQIRSIGTTRYDPPLQFSQTEAIFRRIGQPPTQFGPTITLLGDALVQNDRAAIRTYEARLEDMFGAEPAVYDVLQVRYDPLAYWSNGLYASSRVIGSFEYSGL